MFKERTNTQVESRVRFKVQDLIDKFEKDWKHEIFFLRRNEVDSDGFQKKYVPKGSKLAQQDSYPNQKGAGGKGRPRKNSKLGEEQKKQGAQGSKAANAETGTKAKSMYHLFQSLAPEVSEENKAEESLSEDEEFNRLVDRRMSVNIDNVIEVDFERYNQHKPSQQMKLKIRNLAMEYLQGLDQEHASEEFTDICQKHDTKPFIVIGLIIKYAFS